MMAPPLDDLQKLRELNAVRHFVLVASVTFPGEVAEQPGLAHMNHDPVALVDELLKLAFDGAYMRLWAQDYPDGRIGAAAAAAEQARGRF